MVNVYFYIKSYDDGVERLILQTDILVAMLISI